MMSPETIERIKAQMVEASVYEEDLDESFILGGGPGGQKTNKTSSVVRLFHAPSGMQVRCGATRSRETNRWLARRMLAEAILERERGVKSAERQKREGVLDPYAFLAELTGRAGARPVVCANGTACVVTFQAARIGEESRLFTNSGCASMGYGLPAAIGAAFATGTDVVCVEGDGSLQMNLQELQTVVHYGLPLKIFVLNNDGYHSIRQSQKNARFAGEVGVSAASGVSFPSLERIAAAYGIPFVRISDEKKMERDISCVLSLRGAVLCEVMLDTDVPFAPKVAARIEKDGSISSPPLDDMWPYLSREEYEGARCFS